MTAARGRWPALAFFVFFFALYALTSSGNPFRVPDEFEVYFQVEHLVDAGDISVPQTLAIEQNGEPIFFGKFGRDRRPYAPYGPGIAFLVAPFHLAARAVAALAGVPRLPLPSGIAWEFLVGGITTLAMAFAAALAVAGAYRAFVAIGDEGNARVIALLLGAATIVWVYGTTLYSEAWLAAAFAWAAAFLLEARSLAAPEARTKILAACALVVVAILAKPTAIVIAPGFVAAAALDSSVALPGRMRVALALAAAIALGGATHVLWNVQRFGSPLDFGYNLGGMVLHAPARAFAPEDIPRGIVVQLLAPGKSLIVWAPPILLSLVSIATAWRRERGLVAGLFVALASALIFYAAFLYPEGGYAHGPRHLVPLVPLLMLPAAVTGSPRRHRLLAGVCAVAGITMCVMAVSVSFLEDQSPPQVGTSTGPYYERITPPPGRPWNRYRLDYIPFVTALRSGHWLDDRRPPGNGPDFFLVHLARARRLLPGGSAIPAALPPALGSVYVALLCAGALMLRRTATSATGDRGTPR